MKSDALQTIETHLPFLSSDERLLLIEQLAQQLRRPRSQSGKHAALAAMASDPQIQVELRKIEAEFSIAEADGLEGK